jgi:hypothetical protein
LIIAIAVKESTITLKKLWITAKLPTKTTALLKEAKEAKAEKLHARIMMSGCNLHLVKIPPVKTLQPIAVT